MKLFSPRTGGTFIQYPRQHLASNGSAAKCLYGVSENVPGGSRTCCPVNCIFHCRLIEFFVSLVLARINPFPKQKFSYYQIRTTSSTTIRVRKSGGEEGKVGLEKWTSGWLWCRFDIDIRSQIYYVLTFASAISAHSIPELFALLFSLSLYLSFFLLRVRIWFSRPFSLLRTRVFKLCVPIVACSRNVSLY